jgi:DNA primase traC
MNETKRNIQNEFAERVAAELIEQLKQGTAPFQKPWNPKMGKDMPFNHVTGQPYQGGNALELMMQRRDDPRWLTYRQAQSVGAQVRKGEKGVSLLKLITHTERSAKDENGKVIRNAAGEPLKERVRLEKPYMKWFTVFNAAQVDGLPAYEKTMVMTDHSRAEKLLSSSGAQILHMDIDAAFYAPGPDKIVLPPKEQFISTGAYYATALHELGHWTGHESRLNRAMMNKYGTPEYAREELRAEIASLMLTRELGLPHNPDNHANYVNSWIQVLENDPQEILYACRDASKIKDFVMALEQSIGKDRIETEQNPPGSIVTGQSPREQSLQERLQLAKERYTEQTPTLPPPQQERRRLLESQMESLIKGLPEQTQMQARINFYTSQVEERLRQVQKPEPPGQSEISFDR